MRKYRKRFEFVVVSTKNIRSYHEWIFILLRVSICISNASPGEKRKKRRKKKKEKKGEKENEKQFIGV